MSTPAPTLAQRLNVAVFSAGGAKLKATRINADGSARYEGVPIFRSGTFRDSLGIQHTYEPEHMEQIAFHYDLLAGRSLLTPPVRLDHSISIRNVIGYFTAMRTERGSQHTFVLVDFDVTKASEVEQIESGTYRFRSAEVGLYETNDEATFWPVITGFAFVDMPAVEGLDEFAHATEQHFSLRPYPTTEETPVAPDPTPTPPPPGPPATFRVDGVPTSDTATIQAALDRKPEAPQPHAFRVAGQDVTDVAAVQTHINKLEAFRSESIKTGKDAWVDGLVTKNVITAVQRDGFRAHVDTLDGPAYDAFRALYDQAPENQLFGQHGPDGATGAGATPPAVGSEKDQREIDEAVVADFKRSGMSPEQIEKTEAYKRLQKTAS